MSQHNPHDNGHEFTHFSADDGLSGFIVIVEWDGGIPPTTWYNRLREFGLRVRGDKEVSPIARRVKDAGVISQEGAIVTRKESTAALLASYAKLLGAKAVMTGPISVQSYSMSEQDAKALQRVTSQWGRRGPKNKADAGYYSVTCREQAETFVVELNERPVVCPNCGGTHIFWSRGEARRVAPPTKLPKAKWFDYWANSRFAEGRFSIPFYANDGDIVSLSHNNDLPDEAKAIEGDALAESFGDIEIAMSAYDALYCLAVDNDIDGRWKRRVAILTEYYANSLAPKSYPLSKSCPVDVADLAAMNRRFVSYM